VVQDTLSKVFTLLGKRRASYVLALIGGIIGAVVGWSVTTAVTVWVAGLCGMSDFEGGQGMFAAFTVGPLGGLIAMVGSAWLVLRRGKGSAPLGWMLLRLAIVLTAIAGLVGAGIALRLYTLDTYTNTLPPTLEFEIRVPAAMPVPDPAALRVEVHTDKNVGEGRLADRWSPGESDFRLITGRVPLAFKTSSRLLVVYLPAQPTRLFKLPLARDPDPTKTLSPWRRPDSIDAAGEEELRPAPADDPVEMRYRVRRAGED
jgi:hypothetical protein